MASEVSGAVRLRGQALGHRAGIHVARFSPRYSAPLRRILLLRALQVGVIFDVGANEGQYGRMLRRSGYSGRIISFEPQRRALKKLRRVAAADGNWEVQPFGLGASERTTEIHLSGTSGASSILPISLRHLQEAPEAAYVGHEPIHLRRLDDVLEELTRPEERLAIKLDVQGFEYEVVAGGDRALDRALLIESELQLASYYEGQASAGELMSTFNRHGLELAGTDPGHIDAETGRFTWMDAVFIRPAALPLAADLPPG